MWTDWGRVLREHLEKFISVFYYIWGKCFPVYLVNIVSCIYLIHIHSTLVNRKKCYVNDLLFENLHRRSYLSFVFNVFHWWKPLIWDNFCDLWYNTIVFFYTFHFAGMIIGWSCTKFVNLLPIENSRWPPWLDLV